MGFNEYLVKQRFEKFRQEVRRMDEAFDTSYDIVKVQQGNPTFYYFEIDEKKYRIFVEHSGTYFDNAIAIGFEVLKDGKYDVEGVHNNLKQGEILKLFGTVYRILKRLELDKIHIAANHDKKFRLYLKMAQKLSAKLDFSFVSYDEKIKIIVLSKRSRFNEDYKFCEDFEYFNFEKFN